MALSSKRFRMQPSQGCDAGSSPAGAAIMNLKWIIQNNLGKTDNASKIAMFLEAQGVEWQEISIIPFDESPIEGVDTDGIRIFYGSTGLTRRVFEAQKWTPGVFFDPARFCYEAALQGYGENLVNSDSEVVTVGEFLERDYPDDKLFFTRPSEDSKIFTGALMYFHEMKAWKRVLEGSTERFTFGSKIQVAAPKVIVRETRHFIVNGKVSASSNYGHGLMKYEVEQRDIDYANEMARLYQPADVFTLDTCRLEDESMRMVETNCFNSSGLYWSDVYNLTRDINRFLLEKYG